MADPVFEAALRLLSRRDHFRGELARKLRRKDFDAAEIERALDRCAERDLIDDERNAARFVELRAPAKGWGPRRLVLELEARGVERHIAEAVSRLEPELLRQAMSTALRRAQVRAPDGWWRLPDRRARMVNSLLARGFEASDAIAAVSELAASRENPNHAPDDH